MDFEMVIAQLEDALQTSLESGIKAIRAGNVDGGLADLERGNAKINQALDMLRSIHPATQPGAF
ncbi:MAG: hypothetical protein JWP92_3784 [Caulobacter sp.]|jgi:hypothetical protein|nr:hypothetical protein [Caulobacter sp.]